MTNAKVLVVEDEKIIALDIKLLLQKAGYDVVGIADSYEEAIGKVKEDLPDIILMDIILKGYYNGIDAARKITEKYNIPIIYLTALSNDDTFLKARLEGKPFAYLVKPLKEEELLSTIKQVTNGRALKRDEE
jgi:CheY-like chemotaxis protein